MKRPGLQRLFANLLVVAILIFILAPILVVVVASFSKTPYLVFPPAGFTLQWYSDIILLSQYIDAFRFSLIVASLTTVLSVALALVIALALARTDFRGKNALQAFFLSPIILPELALALGLLQYFSQMGFLRGLIPIVLAHTVICAPYAVRTIQATTYRLDRNLEHSAFSLGARPFQVLRDVTIPLVMPGIATGAIMAFVTSFDNVTISMFLATPGSTPLPALLYNQAAESGLNTTLAVVSTLLILFMVAVILLIERFIGLGHLTGSTIEAHGSAK
ncbi:ABC transporter permease [Aureimonas fodinaquatilis]|uniref:ABC transporter permease n=1 Tax=Aureimonas fodinaquatilis TaxID=2565783 RepID=A0A5B0DWF2_9HYPH|nr:ABC transporter permease [Aureimonas fodinaquatilis]KAA0970763.1 ABC transporter permease [Aureimonas fodinaquatilis]